MFFYEIAKEKCLKYLWSQSRLSHKVHSGQCRHMHYFVAWWFLFRMVLRLFSVNFICSLLFYICNLYAHGTAQRLPISINSIFIYFSRGHNVWRAFDSLMLYVCVCVVCCVGVSYDNVGGGDVCMGVWSFAVIAYCTLLTKSENVNGIAQVPLKN